MATLSIDIRDAQRELISLMEQVSLGTEIILTDNNTPCARIVAIPGKKHRRIPGLHEGAMTTTRDFDFPLPDQFWLGNA